MCVCVGGGGGYFIIFTSASGTENFTLKKNRKFAKNRRRPPPPRLYPLLDHNNSSHLPYSPPDSHFLTLNSSMWADLMTYHLLEQGRARKAEPQRRASAARSHTPGAAFMGQRSHIAFTNQARRGANESLGAAERQCRRDAIITWSMMKDPLQHSARRLFLSENRLRP